MKVIPKKSYRPSKVITDGHYVVQVKSVEDRKVRGIQYLYWKLRILGSSCNDIGEHRLAGTDLILNVPIEGEHVWRLDMFLKAITPEYNGGEFDTADYIGKKLEVVVANHRKDGTPYNYPNVNLCLPYLDPVALEESRQEPQ